MRKAAGFSVVFVALLAACQSSPDDFRELRDGQRLVMTKLADIERKVDQIASRPAAAAAAPGQADPNKVYTIPAGDSPFKGPENAPVTIVEFADFQCPFCSKVPPLIDEVMKAYPKEVKFVYKEFPLTSIHQNAANASRAALAAKRQGKYWEMYDKLFANQTALKIDDLKKYAQELGLDVDKFEKDMTAPEVQKQIDDDTKLAGQIGVTGTPSLFLNGKKVTNRSVEGLKQMVDDALKAKG